MWQEYDLHFSGSGGSRQERLDSILVLICKLCKFMLNIPGLLWLNLNYYIAFLCTVSDVELTQGKRRLVSVQLRCLLAATEYSFSQSVGIWRMAEACASFRDEGLVDSTPRRVEEDDPVDVSHSHRVHGQRMWLLVAAIGKLSLIHPGRSLEGKESF